MPLVGSIPSGRLAGIHVTDNIFEKTNCTEFKKTVTKSSVNPLGVRK